MSPGRLAQVLLILLGYLCGSVSFAYLIGRLRQAIDLRDYGSRKLSGSNVYHFYGVGGMVIVGILDVAKAAVPTWLSMRLGCTAGVTAMVGLAATLGHNWSCYLGFKGGRGISTSLGVLLCIFPWGVLWVLGSLAAGRLMPPRAALAALLGLLTLPLFAVMLQQPKTTVWACWAILLLAVLKRLEANRQPAPIGETVGRVLLRRLLFDRDIDDFDAWVGYRPTGPEEGPLADD